MRYIKTFNESTISIYDERWEKYLPKQIEIIKGNERHKFQKGNVMLNADMLQITYSNTEYGYPNTLEFDIYFIRNGELKLDIDITYGDLVVCEFSIMAPNRVSVIQDTTYHSKFDPSNTIFALSQESLIGFIQFLNRFKGINLSTNDLKFMSEYQSKKL